jgi:hypothetical protein
MKAFSPRLNIFIASIVPSYIVTDDKELTSSFEAVKEHYNKYGVIPVDGDNCENNIFGDRNTNIMFRAWHDLMHISLDEDFSPMAELRVAFAQAAQLPDDWMYEKLLILSEVGGQVAYHDKHGDFIEDQREFTKKLFTTGII